MRAQQCRPRGEARWKLKQAAGPAHRWLPVVTFTKLDSSHRFCLEEPPTNLKRNQKEKINNLVKESYGTTRQKVYEQLLSTRKLLLGNFVQLQLLVA